MSLCVGKSRAGSILLVAWSLFLASVSGAQEQTAKSTDRSVKLFTQSVKPLLQKYCFNCHGPDEQESDLRLDVLDPDMVGGKHVEKVDNRLSRILGQNYLEVSTIV